MGNHLTIPEKRRTLWVIVSPARYTVDGRRRRGEKIVRLDGREGIPWISTIKETRALSIEAFAKLMDSQKPWKWWYRRGHRCVKFKYPKTTKEKS